MDAERVISKLDNIHHRLTKTYRKVTLYLECSWDQKVHRNLETRDFVGAISYTLIFEWEWIRTVAIQTIRCKTKSNETTGEGRIVLEVKRRSGRA